MKTQHTQGPWKANTNLDSPLILSTSTKRNIAYIAWSTEQSVWESKANATLIAAAPELLEALEAVIPDLKLFVSRQGVGPDRRLADCIAAISKARGLL